MYIIIYTHSNSTIISLLLSYTYTSIHQHITEALNVTTNLPPIFYVTSFFANTRSHICNSTQGLKRIHIFTPDKNVHDPLAYSIITLSKDQTIVHHHDHVI